MVEIVKDDGGVNLVIDGDVLPMDCKITAGDLFNLIKDVPRKKKFSDNTQYLLELFQAKHKRTVSELVSIFESRKHVVNGLSTLSKHNQVMSVQRGEYRYCGE